MLLWVFAGFNFGGFLSPVADAPGKTLDIMALLRVSHLPNVHPKKTSGIMAAFDFL